MRAEREGTGLPIPSQNVPNMDFFLAEVPLQQALEGLAVTGLVPGHLMHGVVDGVQVQLLGLLGQLELAGGGAVLGVNAHLQVLLGGVGYDLAQQLGKLGGVLGLKNFHLFCFHFSIKYNK